MGLPDLLEKQLDAWGLVLHEHRCDLLLDYAGLLASYDRSNVIGTKDLDRIVLDHVLDSLSCFLFEPLSEARRLADVGSGGGLPGIPIKIAKPDLRTTLVESTGKKSYFLRYAADALSLKDLAVANARVEDLAHSPEHRAAYDVTTTRAVAHLAVVAEYCVPLLAVGGHAISMKAGLAEAELSEGQKAAGLLGAKISERIPVSFVPELGERERQLLIIEKVRETPPRYPRKPGTPSKRPLGAG
ncbi:MAG: 16S rRNA (guanine(527)-N(7))-methyltransferase RsmG [Actinomycetota bacterium]|nr:16S rRNA (guanine(527)-N(7))-methyltransferase RsmG [Actinomycetota bacterium]